MPPSIQIGDVSAGHSGHGPTPAITGSSFHFVNGKPVVTVGDQWQTAGRHSGITSVQGSTAVFSGGRARVRVGDALSCGDVAGVGDPSVIVGG